MYKRGDLMNTTKEEKSEHLFQDGYRLMQIEAVSDSLKANLSFLKPLEKSAKLKNPKANFLIGYILCVGFKDIPTNIKKGNKILNKCYERLNSLSQVNHDYQATKFLAEYYRVPLAKHIKDDDKVEHYLTLSQNYRELAQGNDRIKFEEPDNSSFTIPENDDNVEDAEKEKTAYDQLVLAIKELSDDGSYDNKERIESIKRSAKAGNIRAANFLGEVYAKGEIVAKDMDTSRLYFEEAESMGSIRAKYMLGVIAIEGSYTRRDVVTGLNKIYQAAKAGLKDAQFYLGKIYYKGELLTRDLKKAYVYFQAAYARGKKEAEQYLRAIESEEKDAIFARF